MIGPDQHPVRGRPRRRAVRDRGEPARLAHRPLRLQGDRRAAREDRLPADARRDARRSGGARDAAGHVSVKEAVLPFARFSGADSLLGPEMKSTGEVMGVGRRLPDRLRQGAGGGRGGAAELGAPCSSPSPTATSRPPPSSPPASTTSASRSSPPAAPPRRSRGWASRSSASTRSRRARPTSSTASSAGEVDLVINTPTGSGARADGYEIRRAATAAGDPLHHDDDRGLGRRARDRRRARGGRGGADPAGAACGSRAAAESA